MRNESGTDIEVIYPAYGGEEDEPPVHSDFAKTPCTYGNNMQQSPTRFDSEDRRMLVTGILVAIMIVLSILLCYLVVPLFCDYLRAKIPVSESRKERRYQTIEGWLVSKRARAHCDTCDELKVLLKLQTSSSPPSAKVDSSNEGDSDQEAQQPKSVPLSPSYDTAETVAQEDHQDLEEACCGYIETESADNECSICMEQFVANDIVSWSPTTTCNHVWHQQCIAEWLLFHDTCPYCRVTVLPVDKLTAERPRGNSTGFDLGLVGTFSKRSRTENLMKLARDRAQRVRTTYYCLEHGLVVLPRPPSPTTKEAQKLYRRFLSTRVKAADLVALRGSRSVKTDVDEGQGIVVVPSTSTSSATDNGNIPFANEVRPLRIVSS